MELDKRIRTLALSAALTLSVVGLPAAHAFAAAPRPGGPAHTGVPVIASGGVSIGRVDVHACDSECSPGKWSEQQCQAAGNEINTYEGKLIQAMDAGNGPAAVDIADYMNSVEDQALSNGCMIIYSD